MVWCEVSLFAFCVDFGDQDFEFCFPSVHSNWFLKAGMANILSERKHTIDLNQVLNHHTYDCNNGSLNLNEPMVILCLLVEAGKARCLQSHGQQDS